MSRFLFAVLFFLSSLTFAQGNGQELFCDIDKVQNKDWSEDVAGYPTLDIEKHISEWQEKADTNPKYLFYLAKSYYDGSGVVLDQNKAMTLYQKAADMGHAPSMNNLAIVNSEDSGKFFSLEKSFDLLCRSAQAGFPLAQANMGEVFLNGNRERKAFKWLQLSVKNKNLRGILLLGDMHANTDSVFYDKKEFNKYLKIAAEMDSVVAQSILGENYYLGVSGYKKNLEKAEYWLLKSAKQGDVVSMWRLSNLYHDYDLEKSFYWASQGVDGKDVPSMLIMGNAYRFGNGTVINIHKSIELYRQVVKLANLKDSVEKSSAATASSNLAFIYSFGYQGIPIDLLETKKWLKKSIELGSELEIEKLIRVNIALQDFSEVKEVISKNTEFEEYAEIINNPNSAESMSEIGAIMISYGLHEGLNFLEKSAQESNVKAQSLLSEIYLGLHHNLRIVTDSRLGVYWTRKAANQGDLMAMNNLGYAYEYGKGVDKNMDEALEWYQMAADGGVALASRNIGTYYQSINDYKKAFKYFSIASEQGNTIAMLDISTMYLAGNDYINKDLEKSFSWALKAAQKFDREAMYVVGSYYLQGTGVKKDADLSLYWIAKSIDNNPNFIGLSGSRNWYIEIAKKTLGLLHKDTKDSLKYQSGKDFYKEFDAENGNDEKKYSAALVYQQEGNMKKAIYWYEIAANNGFVQAQSTLGGLYSGILKSKIQKDFIKAEYWYKKAAGSNDLDSISSLGWLYSVVNKSPGIKNPIFDISKAKIQLEKAREMGSAWALNTLIHNYRFNVGKEATDSVDVPYVLELIKELVALDDKHYPAEQRYIDALEIQVEHDLYIDEFLINKGMSTLTSSAALGDTKRQVDLAEIYLTKKSKFYDREEAFYWLSKAAKISIEANIKLAELYFMAEDYNFSKYGKSLKKAVLLFESKAADDYDHYKNYYIDGMIHAYHSLANYYVSIDASSLAEVSVRKASNLYVFSENNKHEINKNIILASVGDNLEESKKLLIEYMETLDAKENFESISHIYSALIGLHAKLREQGKYKKASQILIDMSDKFTGQQGMFYRPIIELEIARDFVSLERYEKARYHLEKYKDSRDDLKPNFFEKLYADIVYGQDATDKIVDLLQNLSNPIEDVLFKVVSGVIDINEKKSEKGYLKIYEALVKIKDLGIPIRAVDLDFAIKPIQQLVKNKEYEKAKIIMQTVVNLYRHNSKVKIRDGLEISQSERKYISNAVSEYINVSKLAEQDLNDMGFEEMQLVAGLTLSDTLIDSLRLKQYTGTDFAMRKILKDLYSERNQLITEKFNSLSKSASVSKLDIRLNKLDRDISKYELQLVEKDGSVIDTFISPLQDVQEALGGNDALISTLISENRSYVWLVTKDGVYRNDSTLTADHITLLTNQLLSSVNPERVFNKEFSYNASNELYNFMIKPFEDKLTNIDRLIFAPDGVISKIPLTILSKKTGSEKTKYKENTNFRTRGVLVGAISVNTINKPKWLIEDFAIATVPSIYSFVQLNKELQKDKSAIASFAGIGNPILSGKNNVLIRGAVLAEESMRGNLSRSLSSLAPLPETEGELRAISQMFQKSDLFLGMDATEANIRSIDLSKYDVIAFATHALVSNEIDDLYEPALVLTPVDESIQANDGLLSTKEVAKLNLDAEIVVLSACNTASSIDESSAEGLTGLANSFFNAGAKSLLVSYWSVISESAVDITTRIFKPSNEGRSYAHKHRNAVLDLLQNSKDTYKLHPSYWAPFAVIGVN
jgi:TPR repeat protein/CHAT domain-containing protein